MRAELIDAILIWSALPGSEPPSLGHGHRCHRPRGCRRRNSSRDWCVRNLTVTVRSRASTPGSADNMAAFGFFRPYTLDRGGVQPEPWHLSFAPLAVPALAALTPEVLSALRSQRARCTGREAVLARLPQIYSRYVTAIDPPGASVRRPGLFDVTQQQRARGGHRIVEGGRRSADYAAAAASFRCAGSAADS